MRSSRERWAFFNHPAKPPLDAAELAYWKSQALKNSKIGMEFEFNLPEQKGSCKGNSNACPCANMKEAECWKECANKDTCFGKKSYAKCLNKALNCDPADCSSCEHYSVECAGMFCSDFISACITCKSFTTNCAACELRYDPNRNPDSIRSNVKQVLSPNECYGMVNSSGVHSITTDGSLLGNKGIEIITNGRRVDYWEYFKMAQNICRTAEGHGAYLNERCSIHMHHLLSYYSKLVNNPEKFGIPQNVSEMERNMPEIIMANLHQLVRRYQNAMTWMTMALDDPKHMTRWEKFRVSVLPISAVLNNAQTVCNEVSSHSGGNKYGWINYKYCQFGRDGALKRFHVEYRVMDGMFSPSAVAAMACLYYALLVKAIEISRYGILEVGDADWMKQTERVKEALLNGRGGYDGSRFGDTHRLSKYFDILIGESLDLVHQIKHILIKIGPAYQVLEKLAERPIALRRCDGDSWGKIEADLAVETTKEDELAIRLNEFIDLRLVSECQNFEEWVMAVSEELRTDPEISDEVLPADLEEEVTKYVDGKRNDGEMIWSDTLGSIINV